MRVLGSDGSANERARSSAWYHGREMPLVDVLIICLAVVWLVVIVVTGVIEHVRLQRDERRAGLQYRDDGA